MTIFKFADYLAGMLVGAATAVAVGIVVWPGMDMILAMIAGMFVGTIVHVVLGLVFAPLIGMFEAMIPAALIGMYGGMLFGMRDAMAAGSPTVGAAAAVGATFGALIVAAVHYYDRTLKGAVVDTGE